MDLLSKAIGLFGGTFDPIHYGHLRTALELYERLPLQEIRFIPCQQPVHKEASLASSQDRLTMLQLATAGQPQFTIDTRELERGSPSYIYETLLTIRSEVGNNIPLCFICSMDAFSHITQWYRWQDIPTLAHIVVAARAGYMLPPDHEINPLLLARVIHNPQQLLSQPAGNLLFTETTPLAISSTAIRQFIKTQQSPQYLLPDNVMAYIYEQGLYK